MAAALHVEANVASKAAGAGCPELTRIDIASTPLPEDVWKPDAILPTENHFGARAGDSEEEWELQCFAKDVEHGLHQQPKRDATRTLGDSPSSTSQPDDEGVSVSETQKRRRLSHKVACSHFIVPARSGVQILIKPVQQSSSPAVREGVIADDDFAADGDWRNNFFNHLHRWQRKAKKDPSSLEKHSFWNVFETNPKKTKPKRLLYGRKSGRTLATR